MDVDLEKIKLKIGEFLLNFFGTEKETKKINAMALRLIADFCIKFGAICVFSTGDVMDCNGRMYDQNGEFVFENNINQYLTNDYWIKNKYKFKVIQDEHEGYFFGLIIFPGGRQSVCTSEKNISGFIKKITCENNTINIFNNEIILNNGRKVVTQQKNAINAEVIIALEDGLFKIIADLVNNGIGTCYYKYMLGYLVNINEEFREDLSNENTLKSFVLNDFGLGNLFLALEFLYQQVLAQKEEYEIAPRLGRDFVL